MNSKTKNCENCYHKNRINCQYSCIPCKRGKHVKDNWNKKMIEKKHPILWLTGLPCSGKTTISLASSNLMLAEHIDGDDLREILNNSDFSEESRKNQMLSAAYIADRLSRYSLTYVSLISPFEETRNFLKEKYPQIKEIYIKCSLKKCIERDTKGMYKLALENKITDFTGINSPYEEPTDPDLIINTQEKDIKHAIFSLVAYSIRIKGT